MGMLVRNSDEIRIAIQTVPPGRRLFCFFAFDERPSHQAFLDFLLESKEWIDDISANSGIFTFFFHSTWECITDVPGWMGCERPMSNEEKCFLDTFPKERIIVNPTLEIASLLGIKPRHLPGIFIFQTLTDQRDRSILYIPLQNPSTRDEAETLIADTFSYIQEGFEEAQLPDNKRWSVVPFIGKYLTRLGKNNIPSKMREDDLGRMQSILDNTRGTVLSRRIPYLTRQEANSIKIFISYAREDAGMANLIHERLSGFGFKSWIDSEISGGEDWNLVIEERIKEADFFIACLSSNSVRKRGYIRREFRKALDLWNEHLESDIYIIPVRFDSSDIPSEFSRFQAVSLTEPSEGPDGMKTWLNDPGSSNDDVDISNKLESLPWIDFGQGGSEQLFVGQRIDFGQGGARQLFTGQPTDTGWHAIMTAITKGFSA